MKALTIYQPWASLIIAGVKRFETRPRPTHHRGPLAIHAGKLPFDRVWNILGDVREAVRFEQRCMNLLETDNLRDLPKGCVLGTVSVVDCLRTGTRRSTGEPVVWSPPTPLREVTELEASLGDFTPGRYAIEMQAPRALETPIMCRGQQGFWTFLTDEELAYDRGMVDP